MRRLFGAAQARAALGAIGAGFGAAGSSPAVAAPAPAPSAGARLEGGDSSSSSSIGVGDEFASIIVGGGTAGCTTAYLLAKWMQDFDVPGEVLLVDRGVGFRPDTGPSPKMGVWYENWSEFGECHEAHRAEDGSAYPVVPTDHRGLGGCSTHDTRITFQLRPEQKQRMAAEMNWSVERLDAYFQTALNFMPLAPAIDQGAPIPFYSACIQALTAATDGLPPPPPLQRLPDDEHKSGVVVDSVASSSLAMYPPAEHEALRWTPTYLLLDSVRPKNLRVVTDAVVDKIEFETKRGVDNNKKNNTEEELVATGVQLLVGAEGKPVTARLKSSGGNIALTCGAIGTPAVLQRSGCGPGSFLKSLSIPVLLDNPSIGHGIDHEEVAVLFKWLDKWNTPDGQVPKGGAMGWPFVIFSSFRPDLRDLFGSSRPGLSSYYQAHFGAGYAEPYTAFPSVVATPNCLRPDHSETAGYRVFIRSRNPSDTCVLAQGDHRKDLETIAQGVYSVTSLMQRLERAGVVGEQIEPPFPVTVENKEILVDWIRDNHYTVFHWACTCQAGRNGRVADEHFRLRGASNLFIGSAASLPELSENNPHLTISAFSAALAEELAGALASGHDREYNRMRILEVSRADHEVRDARGTLIRRPGQERPALRQLANDHHVEWERLHHSSTD